MAITPAIETLCFCPPTVVLITHYMEEIIHADKVFVMDRGHIAMQGTPREIFSEVEKLKDNPGNRNPLLLPTGQFVGGMLPVLVHPHRLQAFFHPFPYFLRGHAHILRSEPHVWVMLPDGILTCGELVTALGYGTDRLGGTV